MARPVLVAGGGTGGHFLPGLAVARVLRERGRGPVILVGSRRGPEAGFPAEAGIRVVLLPGRGIQRRLTRQNIGAVLGLAQAALRSLVLMLRVRPAVVLCLGGYASGAPTLAAVLLRVPVVVAEQNARAGAVSRLFGRFASRCAVPFEETDLPRATVTGNPVRDDVVAMAERGAEGRAEARAELGVDPDQRLVAVFAGSLGASRINAAVAGVVRGWSDRADLVVHHVVGARDWESTDGPAGSPGGLRYTAVRYEDRMDRLLAAADVAVCRAGGTTVAELAVMGAPAVLVPLPGAPRDHQTANAEVHVRAGGAVRVADVEVDAERLAAELSRILDDGVLRRHMSEAARSVGRPGAAAAVADLVESVARW